MLREIIRDEQQVRKSAKETRCYSKAEVNER